MMRLFGETSFGVGGGRWLLNHRLSWWWGLYRASRYPNESNGREDGRLARWGRHDMSFFHQLGFGLGAPMSCVERQG
jgi:hypothetical protein